MLMPSLFIEAWEGRVPTAWQRDSDERRRRQQSLRWTTLSRDVACKPVALLYTRWGLIHATVYCTEGSDNKVPKWNTESVRSNYAPTNKGIIRTAYIFYEDSMRRSNNQSTDFKYWQYSLIWIKCTKMLLCKVIEYFLIPSSLFRYDYTKVIIILKSNIYSKLPVRCVFVAT